MKQHITEKQYNELSPKQKKVWHKWAVKRGYTMQKVYGDYYKYKTGREFEKEMLLGFPSIGEMIEFIHEAREKDFEFEKFDWHDLDYMNANDWTDYLWIGVKEILEK